MWIMEKAGWGISHLRVHFWQTHPVHLSADITNASLGIWADVFVRHAVLAVPFSHLIASQCGNHHEKSSTQSSFTQHFSAEFVSMTQGLLVNWKVVGSISKIIVNIDWHDSCLIFKDLLMISQFVRFNCTLKRIQVHSRRHRNAWHTGRFPFYLVPVETLPPSCQRKEATCPLFISFLLRIWWWQMMIDGLWRHTDLSPCAWCVHTRQKTNFITQSSLKFSWFGYF